MCGGCGYECRGVSSRVLEGMHVGRSITRGSQRSALGVILQDLFALFLEMSSFTRAWSL